MPDFVPLLWPWHTLPHSYQAQDIQAALQGASLFPALATNVLRQMARGGANPEALRSGFAAYMKANFPRFARGNLSP
jgi:hypothetical protein